jgi:hypothetical protein
MDRLEHLLNQLEKTTFTEKWACVEQLDNALQDVLFYLDAINHKASGELIELKSCSWVLHERYHMDNEEQMKWTFHHTKFKIIRSCRSILEKADNRKKIVALDSDRMGVMESSVKGMIEVE